LIEPFLHRTILTRKHRIGEKRSRIYLQIYDSGEWQMVSRIKPIAYAVLAVALTTGEAFPQTVQNATPSSSTGAVAAPPAASSDEGLAEIVVTAEKRSQNLQKTPAAITEVSGQDLINLNLSDIRNAELLFPSVKFGILSTETHLYIRGIGAEQDRVSIDQLVSMSIDGVNIPHEITGNNFYDVHDIEVLPGPQSTLYGNGGAGGAVVVANNRPNTDRFEINSLVDFGNYAYIHNTSVINVPLSEQFAVRAAVDYARHSAYVSEDFDNEDEVAARLSALYQLDSFSGYVWYSYNNTGGDTPGIVTLTGDHQFANPKNPWNDSVCTPSGAGFPLGANPSCDPFYIGVPNQSVHASIGGADLDWRFNGFSVSLTPSYVTDSLHILNYFGPFSNEQTITTRQSSTELKAVSDSGSPLTWLGGFYWNKQDAYQFFNFNGTPGNPLIWNNENTYAAFGQATYAIVPWLRATAGIRYSSNEKDGHGCNCSAENNEGIYFTSRVTNPHVDWKVGVDADIAPQSLVYATVQTGYANGSYQYFNNSGLLGPQNAGPAPTIRPTELLSYTVGSKNRFFDNRVEVNDEVYYYNYKDLLIAAFSANPASFGNTFYNANLVEIYGDQLDIKWHVTAMDQIQADVGYLHARAINFVVGDPAFNYGGFQLPEAPDVTVTLGYSHTVNLAGGASAVFAGNTHFESGFWGTFQHSPGSRQPAFSQSDVSVTYYSAAGTWNVGLWAKNLENSAVGSVGGAIGSGSAEYVTDLLPPRTYGVQAAWHFDKPR